MQTKFWLSFLTLLGLVTHIKTARSQTYQPSNRTPVADSTLNTQVSGNGNNFNITGGLSRGQTLFHSFTDFSIPTNGQANFLNPVGNRDIISRVTGTAFSDVNGLLNTNGANFFLINPNGIVFGSNARLNVGKAFVGSTATSLDLVDGSGRTVTFGTNPSGDAPLLSVAPNVLFDVSRLNLGGGIGTISNFGKLKTTDDAQYIGFIGGNISMDGGLISTISGRVELGGLSAPGSVGFGTEGNLPKLNFPVGVARADVSLTNQASIDTIGIGGGDIVVTARNLALLGGSSVRAGLDAGVGTPITGAGDIRLNATGIAIVDASSIVNAVQVDTIGTGGNIAIDASVVSLSNGAGVVAGTLGQGNGGKIQIETGVLSLSNAAQIASLTVGQGNAGNVTITAKNAVTLTNASNIGTTVQPGAIGNGGNIQIETGSLSLSGGSAIAAPTAGQGNGGNILVTAKDAVSLTEATGIASTVQPGGVGNGGNIDIKAGSLLLQDGSQLQTATFGASATQPAARGNAGNIDVKVAGSIEMVGAKNGQISGAITNIDTGTTGTGGQIAIDAGGSISFRDGAGLSSDTGGNGNAGSVTVTAKDDITFDSTAGIVSRVVQGGVGNGGNIAVTGRSISFRDGAGLNSETLGHGDAGSIRVTARDALSISGEQNLSRSFLVFRGGLFVNSQSETGAAGDIIVRSPNITLDRDAGFTAVSFTGRGGNITIGGAPILGQSQNELPATDLLLLRRGANISTSAVGDGGNININAKLIVAVPTENSNIAANAYEGKGGNVNINSQGLFGIQFRPTETAGSDITASSEFGQNGVVNISTPGVDPGRDSTELPKVTTDASNQISQVCSAGNRQNKLTITGRGGLPPNANDLLTSDVVWQDARATNSQPAISNTPTPTKLAPPAVGWVFDGKGKVTLIAAGSQGQPLGTSVVCPPIK